ncbi:MAG TPA: 2-iminoacetate synthase ThiH [Acidimicrobiales bacterium]|nr:2-iminoacetate synthase ThiH [Acidimicrobiales bacterium]
MSSIPIALESRPEGVPASSAAADLLATDLAQLRARVDRATAADVERALARPRRNLDDFAALLSPAASDRLETIAAASRETTIRRFGRTVHLFAPLYLSNECVSTCTYCGFSAGNDIARRTLDPEDLLAEARELLDRGFRHLLLVAGEHARVVSKDYLVACVQALAPHVPQLSVEVQVWDTDTYRRLLAAGCDGVVVYQETYDRPTYADVHLKGKKRNYDWRLSAPDRAAEAGMRRLGIAALLGLHADWRSEALAVAAHARALIRRWWRAEVTISLPRLRPAAGGFEPRDPVGDRELVQLLCALRLTLPDVGLVLSTREAASFRDAVLPLGVTHMSAGSRTEPGGYASGRGAEQQFEVADTRSPAEVAAALRAAGYDPVWKDWERA